MSRLASRLRRAELDRAAARTLKKILLETGEEMPVNPNPAALPGDRERLRGIPVVGGVGGTSPGTDPLPALLKKDAQRKDF